MHHCLTPTGVADASLQALERLGTVPASQQQPAQTSASQPGTVAAAAEPPAAAASGGGAARTPGSVLPDVQPLTSRDLEGGATELLAAAPAEAELAEESQTEAVDGDAAAAEQAAAEAVMGDSAGQAETGLPEVGKGTRGAIVIPCFAAPTLLVEHIS